MAHSRMYDLGVTGIAQEGAGGNGVAMRIQPHVWSAADLADPDTYLPGVIRDAVSTHGHPVALAGAAIHAHAYQR